MVNFESLFNEFLDNGNIWTDTINYTRAGYL